MIGFPNARKPSSGPVVSAVGLAGVTPPREARAGGDRRMQRYRSQRVELRATSTAPAPFAMLTMRVNVDG